MSFKNEHLTRQMDLVPLEILWTPITVIGAGAIGGWTTLALAKMGFCNITVYDHDVVDMVNLNSQFYRWQDIGKPKVAALSGLVKDFTGTEIRNHFGRYEKGIFPGIVIAAVDSMEVRRNIWTNHAGKSPFTKAVVDLRMGALDALGYCMNPMDSKDCKSYEKTLYSDSDAVQERCTSKAVMFTSNFISGLASYMVWDRLNNPQKYLRSVQWDIKDMDLFRFRKRP